MSFYSWKLFFNEQDPDYIILEDQTEDETLVTHIYIASVKYWSGETHSNAFQTCQKHTQTRITRIMIAILNWCKYVWVQGYAYKVTTPSNKINFI